MYTGNRRRRWARWFLAWFFGTLALMVIGLVIEQAVSPGSSQPQSLQPTAIPTPPWANSPAPAASPSPSAVPTSPVPTSPALTGTVQLVQGREEINGVYLGFPHSTVGAVSAADEFVAEVGGTLDPDRAAAVMRMVADPSYTNGPQQAADGAVNDRKDLGLPASGPVPQGASLQIEPVEYQVRDVTPDQVTVLLLCDFISTLPAQGTQTKIGVFPARMHWAEDDWKVLAGTSAAYENLTADPDSPQAATLGWQNLEPARG